MRGKDSGNLEILLDSDLYSGRGLQPTFTPGSTISGRVLYTPSSRKTIDEVIIILRGRCYTVVRDPDVAGFGKDSYAEDTDLFRLEQTLLTGPFTMQSTTTEWRFKFVLPKQVTGTRQAGRENNWLYESRAHATPPSTTSVGQGHQALLTYALKVIINPNSHHRLERWNLPIAVTSTSDSALPEARATPHGFEEARRSKLNKSPVEKLSFRQKMSHAFTKDSGRHSELPFVATAYMPDAASLSQELPIAVSLRQTASIQGVEQSVFVLTAASLELQAKVHVRVNIRQDDLDAKIWEELGQHTLLHAETPLPSRGEAIELASSVRLADIVPEKERDREFLSSLQHSTLKTDVDFRRYNALIQDIHHQSQLLPRAEHRHPRSTL